LESTVAAAATSQCLRGLLVVIREVDDFCGSTAPLSTIKDPMTMRVLMTESGRYIRTLYVIPRTILNTI